jgi:hypothetical protein
MRILIQSDFLPNAPSMHLTQTKPMGELHMNIVEAQSIGSLGISFDMDRDMVRDLHGALGLILANWEPA